MHLIGKLLLKDMGEKVICTVLANFCMFVVILKILMEIIIIIIIEEVKGIEERMGDVKEDIEEIDKV